MWWTAFDYGDVKHPSIFTNASWVRRMALSKKVVKLWQIKHFFTFRGAGYTSHSWCICYLFIFLLAAALTNYDPSRLHQRLDIPLLTDLIVVLTPKFCFAIIWCVQFTRSRHLSYTIKSWRFLDYRYPWSFHVSSKTSRNRTTWSLISSSCTRRPARWPRGRADGAFGEMVNHPSQRR